MAFVREARAVTRRLHGAQTYLRLLAAAGVLRRPSTATVQKAIEQVRDEGMEDRPRSVDAMGVDARGLIEAAVRRAVGERIQAPVAESTDANLKIRLQASEQALADAYRRIRQLKQENSELRRQLGRADGAAQATQHSLAQAVAQLHAERAAGHGAAAHLAETANRLAGTERFLKLQNDAVRQQIEGSARQWQRRAESLEGRVKQQAELIEVLRRTVASRGDGVAGDRR